MLTQRSTLTPLLRTIETPTLSILPSLLVSRIRHLRVVLLRTTERPRETVSLQAILCSLQLLANLTKIQISSAPREPPKLSRELRLPPRGMLDSGRATPLLGLMLWATTNLLSRRETASCIILSPQDKRRTGAAMYLRGLNLIDLLERTWHEAMLVEVDYTVIPSRISIQDRTWPVLSREKQLPSTRLRWLPMIAN